MSDPESLVLIELGFESIVTESIVGRRKRVEPEAMVEIQHLSSLSLSAVTRRFNIYVPSVSVQ